MKSILLIFVMIMATSSLLAQTVDSLPKFDSTRNPSEDLKAAVELARNNNKRIILDIGGEWCIWCHRIDAFVQNTGELEKDKDYDKDKFIAFLNKWKPVKN